MIKKRFILFLTSFLLVLCPLFSFADTLTVDISKKMTLPQHYIAAKVNATITVDGQANEKAWDSAPFSNSFIDIEGVKIPKFDTKVKMLWDANYIYVYAELEEPHIWGDLTERDAVIFYNNDFEVFIDPSGDGQNYGEIEINALGTVWDLFLNKAYRLGGKANNYWNLNELKSAVHLDGSLNDPSDTDQSWSVELAIPLAPFVAMKDKPKTIPAEGEQWRINFSRVQWDHDVIKGKYERKKVNGIFQSEYNWVWSSQGEINMHIPEKWGYLQFTEKTNSNAVSFVQDEKQLIGHATYCLFRKIKFGSLSHLQKMTPFASQVLNIKISETETLLANYTKTTLGFEIAVHKNNSESSYIMNEQGRLTVKKNRSIPNFTFSTWAHGSSDFDKTVWTKKMEEYSELGISEVLIGGSPNFLQQLVPLAKEYGIKIHAWMWTLNRPNDTTANQHPDWYAVNRAGKNSLEYRAYVDYYQWLSPFHPEAREYIKNNVRKLAEVEGLASIHLDYVRYVDVILGKDLQPKYDLVQDKEMPEFDYGYHPIAREGFKNVFGYDPIDIEHPELSTEWRQYRLNAITTLVNELVEIAHSKNHEMTAAVFPFPEMSRQMVRQAWNDWNLDAAYPMLYQNFYQESVNWIGFATAQGVNDVDFPIHAGLYGPALQNPDELEKAIRLAKENGASGVSIFTADGLSDEQKAVFKRLHKEFH